MGLLPSSNRQSYFRLFFLINVKTIRDLLKLIMQAITLKFSDVIFVHAHIDFVDHAVFKFVEKNKQ